MTADSYAWLLSFNSLSYYFDWQSDGDFHVIHDEFKRDTQTDCTDIDADVDVEHDPDTVLDADSLDVTKFILRQAVRKSGAIPWTWSVSMWVRLKLIVT